MVSFRRTEFRARRAVGLLLAGLVGAQADPCDTCSSCYNLGTGECYSTGLGSCVSNAYTMWCGPNPCDSCSGCYKHDYDECDTAISDQSNCFYWRGVWCGAAEPTCSGCNSCYLPSHGTVNNLCA